MNNTKHKSKSDGVKSGGVNNNLNMWSRERTLVVIKPDGVQRSLIGEIIARYERVGLKMVAMKMFHPSKNHIEKHYTLDPEWLRLVGEKSISGRSKTPKNGQSQNLNAEDYIAAGRKILDRLVEYVSAGPVIAMVWQGPHAVSMARKITGSTEPLSSDVGTIRGDFVIDSYEMSDALDRAVRNLVHASSSPHEAENEILHWFAKDEVHDYISVNDALV